MRMPFLATAATVPAEGRPPVSARAVDHTRRKPVEQVALDVELARDVGLGEAELTGVAQEPAQGRRVAQDDGRGVGGAGDACRPTP